MCEIYKKKAFSQSVSEPEFFLYISNDLSEDDYYSETAGDYILNTLLVCIYGCLSFTFLGLYTLYSTHVILSCHICATIEA